MKYCQNCEQHVEPEGRINWVIFAILFVMLAPWIPYLVYCLLFKDKTCPQCGAANWDEEDDHDHDDEADE